MRAVSTRARSVRVLCLQYDRLHEPDEGGCKNGGEIVAVGEIGRKHFIYVYICLCILMTNHTIKLTYECVSVCLFVDVC